MVRRWSCLWNEVSRPPASMMSPSVPAFPRVRSISISTARKEDLFKAVIREGIVSRIAEAEEHIRNYQGATAALIRELVHDWWDQIGATKLGGIAKLMMSEAGNFPELAKFYHDEVVVRGMGLFATAIQRGISAGEFRKVPLEFAPRIACAPVLMLMLWRNSFDLCDTHG